MLNQVTLIGRLGKDPETRLFDGGNQVSTFSLATDEKYKDKSGELKQVTDWHNLVVWGKGSEIAEKYLKKGSLIHITGKIKTRKYEDKEGQTRYVTEIIVDRFLMLGSKGERSDPGPMPGDLTDDIVDASVAANPNAGPTDDLPF